MKDYKKINKAAWNLKTDIHIKSEFYNNTLFLKGDSSLKHIELDLLGEIKDKSILHMQCHFGQDTISLSRLGAKATGIDISDNAINYAQNMAKELEMVFCRYIIIRYRTKTV
ncbi:SAM-dependent methyltransferase [Bacteroides nordii]|jgi:2-polyprenyl-3-methyl-5-hydroxy-6-metoxy-1,4-benzoquinol methylase|uniref:class I SAM-dependent methyltransferase n=1 Tax=Bacteroides nordii TaxID=291645 RepID=UPI00047243A0|nr:SAM-dependent methyltransferase [Bacteroides nordii]UAK44264.1 SAM-dependent methyltransferase [Bacteroides nordii]